MPDNVPLFLAFGAGIASFISPCVLPLVPIYLAYLGGAGAQVAALEENRRSRQTLWHAFLFVLGFTLVFTLLGASAGVLGSVLRPQMGLIRQASGVLLVILGLWMVGVFNLPFLQTERRFHLNPAGSAGKTRSFVLGALFGFGWTPCIGPILGSILSLALDSQTATQGAFLLVLYSAGLGIPFLLAGIAVDRATKYISGIKRYMRPLTIASGVMIMAMGVLVFFNVFQRLSGLFIWGF